MPRSILALLLAVLPIFPQLVFGQAQWPLTADPSAAPDVKVLMRPETVGVSAERLGRIDQLVRRNIAQNEIVGAITMVSRDGHVVHFNAAGHADVEADKPMRSDTIVRIYSMTKPVTSVAAMILYEEGDFQLGDRVSKFLPEFADLQVQTKKGLEEPLRGMTMLHLLTHTSGLTYGLFGITQVDRDYNKVNVIDYQSDLQTMMDKLTKIPLLNHPGEQWQYSVSTDVLGRVVEVLSGMPLDEFFRKRIFEPLRMTDTGFSVPPEKIDRLAVNYKWNEMGQRSVADHPSDSRYSKPAVLLSGGGGLVSTAADYMRFCRMLLRGGALDGQRILGAKTVEIMMMDHVGDAELPTTGMQLGGGAGFGLGFRVVTDAARNGRLVSNGACSWGGMASTAFFIDPKERLIGIVMTQKFPTDMRLRDEFQTAVYQSLTQLHD